MTRIKPLPALALLLLGACAVHQPGPPAERNATLRLERGLAALEAGRYRESFDDLAWVYSHCPGHEAAAHALAGLTALELDPRNPLARPGLGVELFGRLIRSPAPPRWTRPLLEAAYLESLALGATPDSGLADRTPPPAGQGPSDLGFGAAPFQQEGGPAYRCGSRLDEGNRPAKPLPTLPGPSMWSLLTAAEAQRDSLAARSDSLQARLDRTAQQLTATREELERIRKTLKP